MKAKKPIRVLFVCLGNICRSPTAHGIFEAMVKAEGLADIIEVDSAGTSGWHIGATPDKRSMAAALQRGYDLSDLRARSVAVEDFALYHYILAMDSENLRELKNIKPADYSGHLSLFLDFAEESGAEEVPDPYYGGAQGFDHVLDLVEAASAGLLEHIRKNEDIRP